MVMNRDLTWSDEHIILCADEGVHLKPINLINQCHPSKFIKKKGGGRKSICLTRQARESLSFMNRKIMMNAFRENILQNYTKMK